MRKFIKCIKSTDHITLSKIQFPNVGVIIITYITELTTLLVEYC